MHAFLLALAVYSLLGVVLATVYVMRIAPARDSALRESPKRVRVLLFPAAVALWPLLLRRPGGAHETDPAILRNRHFLLWLFIAPLTFAAVVLALLLRSAP